MMMNPLDDKTSDDATASKLIERKIFRATPYNDIFEPADYSEISQRETAYDMSRKICQCGCPLILVGSVEWSPMSNKLTFACPEHADSPTDHQIESIVIKKPVTAHAHFDVGLPMGRMKPEDATLWRTYFQPKFIDSRTAKSVEDARVSFPDEK